jgi:rhomboid protease GluP
MAKPTATIKAVEKRRMCPNCRAFIEITDRVCPYCEASVGPRAVDMRPNAFTASLLPRANLTAIILLAINFGIFIVQLGLSHKMDNPDLDLGASRAFFVLHGQWWRLITAGFLHANWLHLLMNSWSLFILVTEVEQFYGTSRLIVAYVFSTVAGFVLACFWTPNSQVLGASCAAFGLMGIMLAMGIGQRADALTQAVRQHYGQWIVFGLVMSYGPSISMAGHVGGLIGGFAVGLIAGRPGLPGTSRERFWRAAAGFAIALVLWSWYRDFAYISLILRQGVSL